ncbi:MAG: peptidylprolyl isomerase [Acidobacteria bacterium]|nr:peptidylprolyl isomerase [Acidobacteriota bacterium]
MDKIVRNIGIIFVFAGCITVTASAVESNVPHSTARPLVVGTPCTTSVSQKEIGFLLAGGSPETRRKMTDPAFRKQQFDDLRRMFAIACQAVKDGFADESDSGAVLKLMEIGVIAQEYDRITSKTSGATQYEWITTEQIEEFYGDRQNLTDFENFQALQKRKSPEETQDGPEARREFAVMMIAYRESLERANELPADFRERTDFAVRAQQAQYLNRLYSERVLAPKTKATDAEIDAYIAARPQYSTVAKRNRAEGILKRALAGENFAVLARTNSEDPGSKAAGGLYENVVPGTFIDDIETAALRLAPGEIARQLVESSFGFHIVKLERKGETRDANGKLGMTFDVRHILISTMVKESNSPAARKIPVREFVRNTIEDEREKLAMDAIVKANPVTIAGEAPNATKKPAPRKK